MRASELTRTDRLEGPAVHLRRNFLSRYGRDIRCLFRNDVGSWLFNRTVRNIWQIVRSLFRRNFQGLFRVLWVMGHIALLHVDPTGMDSRMFREVVAHG